MVRNGEDWADISLVALKILLGLSLLGFSAVRQEGMEDREKEDAVNNFGRSAVGETKAEAVSLSTDTTLTSGVQQADYAPSLPIPR
jgi:hypothetical protein